MSEPIDERSWRCSTLFHQRSIWLRTMAGSSTRSAHLGRRESRVLSAPATAEKNSHPGKTLTPPAAAISTAISSSSSVAWRFHALLAQASVHGGEQMLGNRSFRQRQQLGFIQTALRALRIRIELADGFNFVAEELDADGAIGFRGVDIENAAAAGELAGHLDEIHLGVADAGEVRSEDFDVDFFAALEGDGKAGVVVAIEELAARQLRRGR